MPRAVAAPVALARLVPAVVAVLRARRAVRRHGFEGAAGRLVVAVGEGAQARGTPQAWATAVRRASGLVRGTTCVPRAIASASLLARHGHDPVIVLGCRRNGQAWEAHAWVEHHGRALDEPRAEAFRRLAELLPAGQLRKVD